VTRRDDDKLSEKISKGRSTRGTGGRGKSGWQAMEGGDSELDGWSV